MCGEEQREKTVGGQDKLTPSEFIQDAHRERSYYLIFLICSDEKIIDNLSWKLYFFRKIVIHDTSPFVFNMLLEYLYSGRLDYSAMKIEHLVDLLLLSDKYEIDSLKHTCEHALLKSIDSDTVLYFLSMADQYNARILKVCKIWKIKKKLFCDCDLLWIRNVFDQFWCFIIWKPQK